MTLVELITMTLDQLAEMSIEDRRTETVPIIEVDSVVYEAPDYPVEDDVRDGLRYRFETRRGDLNVNNSETLETGRCRRSRGVLVSGG